jgi:hypothetical protein
VKTGKKKLNAKNTNIGASLVLVNVFNYDVEDQRRQKEMQDVEFENKAN